MDWGLSTSSELRVNECVKVYTLSRIINRVLCLTFYFSDLTAKRLVLDKGSYILLFNEPASLSTRPDKENILIFYYFL